MKNFIFLLSIVIIAICGISNAQIQKSTFFRESTLHTGVSIQTWSTSEDRITEFVIPVSYVLPISKDFTLNAITSTAYAELSSAKDNIIGFTDTRLTGSYIGLDNHLLVTGSVCAPTGKTRLKGDQSSVASALAMYPFSFRVPSFGQGLSAGISAVYAFEISNIILGGGFGFNYKNGFKPYDNSDEKYAPGIEASLNLGGETNAGNRRGMKLTWDITYTFYGADKYGGKEVFKSGNKLMINLRSIFKAGSTDIMAYLNERTKGKNDKGFGTLITEQKNSNGNQLELGGMSYSPLNDKFGIKGLAEIKFYSKNEYESNGALVFALGSGFNYAFTNNFNFDLNAKFSFGSLKNKSESISVTGLELTGGLKFRF
jgi:hypothetical protein